ncbi:unnamed protein product [Caenorhabditis brenneri]
MSKIISLILLLLFVGNVLSYMKNNPVQHLSDPIGNETEEENLQTNWEHIVELLNRLKLSLQVLEVKLVKLNKQYTSMNVTDTNTNR